MEPVIPRQVPRIERISKRSVDQAQPQETRFTLWDRDLKGFGVQIAPSGQKTYVVRYRLGGGRTGVAKQLTLGRHGPLTPDMARDKALKTLALVADGRDPQGEKHADRRRISVAELCDVYLSEGVATKKEATVRLDRLRIERHIKPMLGRFIAAELTRADVERAMVAIAEGDLKGEVTPHMRGGRGAAARVVGLLGGIFTFAITRGVRTDNPVRGIKRFQDNKRERFLSSRELGQLGDVLRDERRAGGNPLHVDIIRLLVLTGARKNEIVQLKWNEVDLERGLLNLRDSKTGSRAIRIGAPALAILATLPRGAIHVFPQSSAEDAPVRGIDWAWVRIRGKAGLEDVRIHDLRHSFASVGLASGQALPMIGKLLGHRHVQTTARYAHLADDPVALAANRISELIEAALGQSRSEVSELRRG